MGSNEAEGRLWRLFWVGLALSVLAGVILAGAWPGTETQVTEKECTYLDGYCPDPETVKTGSTGGMVVGLIVAATGNLSLMVSLVGFAVMLGTRAAGRTGSS